MSVTTAPSPARRGGRTWDTILSPGWARLGVIILLLVVWELFVRFFGDPLFMSPPSHVAVALVDMVRNRPVMAALGITLYELVIAFLLSITIGATLGLAIGLQRFPRTTFYPVILLLYAIPQAVILPLFVLGFGIGPASKIAFGVSHGIFPIIVNVVAGVQNLKPTLLVAARSMGASRRQILTNVVLPHMIPSFFTGMRLAMTSVLLGVLLAELYVSQAGVGHFTRLFTESFQPQNLFAIITLLATIAVSLNALCRWAERRMSRWHE